MKTQYQFEWMLVTSLRHWRLTAAMWAICAAASISAQTTPTKLNLRQTIDYALLHSSKIKSEHFKNEIVQLAESDARASYFPKINAVAGAQLSETNSSLAGNTTTAKTTYAGLEFTQTLLDDGSRRLAYDTATIAKQKSDLELRDQRDLLILNVIQNFVELSAATLELSVNQETLRDLKRQAEESFAAVRQGMKPKRDYLRVETQMQRQLLAVNSATDAVVGIRQKLCDAIGVNRGEPCPEFSIMEPKEKIALDLKKFSTLNPASSNLAAKYSFEIEALEKQTAHERSRRFWPQLSLNATAGFRANHDWQADENENEKANDNQKSWLLQLSLTYPLWDNGSVSRRITTTALQKSLQENEKSVALNQWTLQVSDIDRSLEDAAATLDLNAKILKLDREAYDLIYRDYRQGKATYLDLIEVREKLLQSQVGVARAYFTAYQKIWERHYYAGDIYESLDKI